MSDHIERIKRRLPEGYSKLYERKPDGNSQIFIKGTELYGQEIDHKPRCQMFVRQPGRECNCLPERRLIKLTTPEQIQEYIHD